MKTKKPSAIVYGWYKHGEELLESTVYNEEGLFEDVLVYSLPYRGSIIEDYNTYRPDIIVTIGEDLFPEHYQLRRITYHFDEMVSDEVLANEIVSQAVFTHCEVIRPRFSIFTPTYNTGERIMRTYEGLKRQTWTNWEWVVVDDSPDEETFILLKKIAAEDYRVKIHRIYPLSGGCVGLAKNRAAMLCIGDWLIELDHDDYLTYDCLSTLNDAIETYPDAGFVYTDCSEMYDDGEPKYYDHDWSGNWYARPDNFFDFGYAGHTWTEADGKQVLAHWYPNINPLTIRFNISMPNHARVWKRELYHEIGGHNKNTPVADDLEILIRTFLNTRMIHLRRVLYFQYNNRNSTVDNNAQDINRRARLIRDYYDEAIHKKINELGYYDWAWNETEGHSFKFQNRVSIKKFHEEEQVMNYIYE